jgi:Na+:H+ antiporter, NhaA family
LSRIQVQRPSFIHRFLSTEASGGILIMLAAALAMLCANTSLRGFYEAWLHWDITLGVGEAHISMELSHLINDGLMAIFFFMVGMEIKRELMEGELSSIKRAALPFAAACGGVVAPALIFVFINSGNAEALRGWAIPTATDIAFALGVLALLGSRVPTSLKVFLTAVAVIDDLIAVMIIALFYTDSIALNAVVLAGGCVALLLTLNLRGVSRVLPYALVGLVLWGAVLQSGIHASIAGAVLGVFIPLSHIRPNCTSPLKSAVSWLHPWVAFGILPLFAFANAGVVLDGIEVKQLTESVPLGIAAGLFFGKQFGIFAVSCLMIYTGWAHKPDGATWGQFYAVCVICGIGFTMSLFVGGLSYDTPLLLTETKLGVMMGSLTSGIMGYGLMRWYVQRK